MQIIINQSLSDMLDKLLQKALEEKPDLISKHSITYNYLFSIYILDEELYDIIIDVRKNKESMANYINYIYDLTPHQKEMINKIFEKWSKGNADIHNWIFIRRYNRKR